MSATIRDTLLLSVLSTGKHIYRDLLLLEKRKNSPIHDCNRIWTNQYNMHYGWFMLRGNVMLEAISHC